MKHKEADPKAERLLALLRTHVAASGRTQRDLEREIGLGHGSIGNILSGRTALRVHHISLLAGAIGFNELELFLEAYAYAGLDAFRNILADTIRSELQALCSGEIEIPSAVMVRVRASDVRP